MFLLRLHGALNPYRGATPSPAALASVFEAMRRLAHLLAMMGRTQPIKAKPKLCVSFVFIPGDFAEMNTTATTEKEVVKKKAHEAGLPGMVFFFWTRPSAQDQKICLDKAGPLNYKAKYKGATANSASTLKEDTELLQDGFFTNHARVLVGSGLETYERGKTALHNWRHFGLNWAFVDSTTQIQNGVRFCVCTKEFVPWLVMPLEVVYVTESRNNKKGIASYRFGSGTLGGHLLAGEERFSIELDDNNQVWYEILSISKPAHFLSFIGYPYVQLKQKLFANQSGNAMLNYLKAS